MPAAQPCPMNFKAEALKKRTAAFAKRVSDLCDRLPKTDAGRTASTQLTDAATSVAVNYRASCRARSKREFIAKIGQVEEEADECVAWLEFIDAKRLLPPEEVAPELDEARQLTAIFTASHRTAKQDRKGRPAEGGGPPASRTKHPVQPTQPSEDGKDQSSIPE
jgi:four helix bundle protein